MGGEEGIVQISVASVVEDVLQQGKRLNDIDFASRKAEEASLRRYVAAGWLRKTIGVVAAKDLPAEPSEEDFRLGLRSGIVLCNVLNKIQPGAVQKVVEAPADSANVPDGAALSAYQYFENVRNFLVAVEKMGLPSFEASDLEKGGKSSRIINCVLALKSYAEWKQGGGSGSWKYSGNSKPPSAGKQFVRRNSEPFMNSISRTISDKSLDNSDVGHDGREMGNSSSLHILVHELLSDQKQEDIPFIVENMLNKVMEEFEHRLASQNEQSKTSHGETVFSTTDESPLELTRVEAQVSIVKDEEKTPYEGTCSRVDIDGDGASTIQLVKPLMLVEHQHKEVQQLKSTLHAAKVDMQFLQLKYQEEVNNLGKHLHGLAHAASNYQKVLEENRKLYNQVQDLKGNIRVYCRVRPFLPGQPNSISTVDHIYEGNITITTPSKYGKEGKKSFTFNKVFGPSATQAEVFADTQPLIRSVLDGYNVCIFAYGQTGSGKTHTMTGPSDLTKETLGVNYRALSDLFIISEQRKDIISYDISVQMVEIYNEQVRDLLTPDGVNKKVEIRNSSQKGFNLPDANLVPVTSTSDVLNLMNLGHKNRAVSATALNDRSSRSHSCLTVHVQGRNMASGTILRGSMHLVDLAGSERVDKSEVLGDRLKEATHINKSLSALGDVIASLAQKNSHVPYRNSKLTQLLQDSLGGQAKTLMFVHISPELNAVGETLTTLKFSERVSTVELGSARANKEGSDVKELREQLSSLKAALARKEEEQGWGSLSRSSTPERVRTGSSHSSSWHSMEDNVNSNMEFKKKSTSKVRRRSLDPKDFQITSPPWLPANSPASGEEDRESVSSDWVDKIMVNKQDGHLLYRKCSPDSSKVYPEQPINKVGGNKKEGQDDDASMTRSEAGSLDDFNDLEAATSESSELECPWQPNLQKASQIPNGLGSKLKKPSPKQVKKPEIRSLIPTPPSRRLSNGLISPSAKTGRAADLEGKRKVSGK
ncbi:unnamed protein product [Withania somnifera]